MKINEGFILKSVGGENVVLAVGKASTYLNGIIRLNKTGALLWERMAADGGAEEAELVSLLVDTYHIDASAAESDVAFFLTSLKPVHCIVE